MPDTNPRPGWLKAHRKHEWREMSTSHIRNVDYLRTHDLVLCSCKWYGWVEKEA
ncbi:hypothetical protein SEA_CECE_273 [Microbacterium phage Cece]|nr:hypothetical protein SEA_CECE_273 [Microbacterium phage Cece]